MIRWSAVIPEPKFLNILKCNLAESVSAGFQFNCFDIFNDKTLNYRHLDHFSGLLKFIQKFFFYRQTKTSRTNPVVPVLSDLWKDSSLRKVDFSASSKCLRIRAQEESHLQQVCVREICMMTFMKITQESVAGLNSWTFHGAKDNFSKKKNERYLSTHTCIFRILKHSGYLCRNATDCSCAARMMVSKQTKHQIKGKNTKITCEKDNSLKKDWLCCFQFYFLTLHFNEIPVLEECVC
jgi:hypothetical protein